MEDPKARFWGGKLIRRRTRTTVMKRTGSLLWVLLLAFEDEQDDLESDSDVEAEPLQGGHGRCSDRPA